MTSQRLINRHCAASLLNPCAVYSEPPGVLQKQFSSYAVPPLQLAGRELKGVIPAPRPQ